MKPIFLSLAAVLSVAHDAARNVSCLSGGGFTCVDVERMLLNYRDSSSGIWTDSFQPNMSLWYGAWVSALPVFVAGFRFESSTINREVTRFATFAEYSESQLGQWWHGTPAPYQGN
jgi:hypothetical protein